MLHDLIQSANGLGELILIPEDDDDREKIRRCRPLDVPAGTLVGHEIRASDGALILFARTDPNYRPPALAPTQSTGSAVGFVPVPSRAQLEEWTVDNLVTKLAEFCLTRKGAETKASMAARLHEAWDAHNKKLNKPAEV